MSESKTERKSHASKVPASGVDIPKAFLEKMVDPFVKPELGYKSRPEVVKIAIREFFEKHAKDLA
nr:ribbon-helix-helix domain-containing protein [Candidatus Sigynarchaeota archaeon]